MDYKQRMNSWLDSDRVTEEEKEYIRNATEEVQKEMFSSNLAFGTAGMRALLGPGCARLNILTVRRATIGVGNFLLSYYSADEARRRGIAISFDNRHFSKEFRDTATEVLTNMGINVFTFREPHPTPELSYTVRKLHCVGGIMLTASHNSKEYNGYKYYDENGCQGVYEVIDKLISIIEALPDELEVSYPIVSDDIKGKVVYLDDDDSYDENFIKDEVSTSLYKDFYNGERLTKIVFTPQCGANCKVGPMALRAAGYEVETVPGQDFFDPDFTGTPNPNPETEEAYLASFDYLKKLNASGKKFNLILCTDPDADRCGLAFLDRKGKIQRFTGNQTGALLIDFLLGTLQRRKSLPTNGTICNTFVTGSQGAKVASLYGVRVRTTATGFKYIGDMVNRMNEEGEKYLFGYEESYGYLLADFVRDKDSLQSIIAIADMVEYYLRQGKTLDMALEALDQKTGHYFNTQKSFVFEGADSNEKMKAEVSKLRSNPFSELCGLKVATLTDYKERTVKNFQTQQTTALNAPDIDTTNCLRFDFEDGCFIAVRPSGTEPKIKFYFEICNRTEEEASELFEKMVSELKALLGL